MTTQSKYDYLIKNFKSLDGAMLLINNQNLYQIFKRYSIKPKFVFLDLNANEYKISPVFDSELVLIVNLMYKILKNQENDT